MDRMMVRPLLAILEEKNKIKSGSATGVHNWDMTVVDIAVTVSVIALVTPPGCATVPVFHYPLNL